MTATSFVDTNILLYSTVPHESEQDKAEIADGILDSPDLALSVQVLQEFYVQATRPTRENAISHEDAIALIATWKRYPVLPITTDLMEKALVARDRWRISYWDAAIIEAARMAGCSRVYSEDLADGQSYDGVEVVNPFRT